MRGQPEVHDCRQRGAEGAEQPPSAVALRCRPGWLATGLPALVGGTQVEVGHGGVLLAARVGLLVGAFTKPSSSSPLWSYRSRAEGYAGGVRGGRFIPCGEARRRARDAAAQRVASIAATVAGLPEVARALGTDDPTAELQPLAERIRRDADVSFVVVMAPDGTRYSHPNPAEIGGTYIGTIAPAVAGGTVVETFVGTLGPSVRSVVPVVRPGAGPDEPPVGLVSVGVTLDRVAEPLRPAVVLLALASVASLALAAGGAGWIARRLRRLTFGLAPAELAREHAHHEAVLHAVREGLLVVDDNRRLLLANDAARALLGLDADAEGRLVSELPLDGALADLLATGAEARDELHLAGERLVVVNQRPVGAGRLGTVVTMRDHTEVAALADELGTVRSLVASLRAQAHEAANRLHTVVTLVDLGDTDAALRLATSEARSAQDLADRLVGRLDEPALVALLLGKASEAHERGVALVVGGAGTVSATGYDATDLVTILGNLIDNAVDASQTGPEPRTVTVTIEEDGDELVIEVQDSGAGFTDEQAAHAFDPGWSTKPAEPGRRHGRGIGLALVRQVLRRLDGTVTLRNLDERGAAVTARLPLRRAVPREAGQR
jgi:two-component system, CitB family, sensor kinase